MISGFVYGAVSHIDDPQGLGCARVRIPGLFEEGTPYWCRPGGWPGAGGVGQGSQYPIQVGQQVIVIFEFGDPDAGAVFFPTLYGRSELLGTVSGPTAITEVAGAEARNRRVVLWDDDIFSVHATLEGDPEGRKLVLIEKESGAHITIDARDGPDGKSKSIAIEARTGVIVKSKGRISLDAANVYINGRRVMRGGGSI